MPEPRIFNGIVNPVFVNGKPGGPLSGSTFVAKDNFDIAGLSCAAGVPDWQRTHDPAIKTADAIQTMLDAGATLIGKSCMDELAFSLHGINMHYGVPSNPNIPGAIPGGSSSGSASAVAAGLCDFALGSDTLGSVRVPGAFCGVLSMRPTHGRISTDGLLPLGPSFDTVGWFARDCDLFVKCGELLLGEKVGDLKGHDLNSKLTKIRLLGDGFNLLEEKLKQPFLSACEDLDIGIHGSIPIDLPANSLEHWFQIFEKMRGWEAWQYFGKWMLESNPSMHEVIKQRFLSCKNISEAEKTKAQSEQLEAREFLNNLLCDQIVCIPTVFSWPISCQSTDEQLLANRNRNNFLNVIASLGGLPQVHIPISLKGHSARFGLSLIAKPGDDCLLLSVARLIVSRDI